MTSQGSAHGRFQRAIHRRHVQAAEMAAREMGGLSLADALLLCELLANADAARYERAALRWLRHSLGGWLRRWRVALVRNCAEVRMDFSGVTRCLG